MNMKSSLLLMLVLLTAIYAANSQSQSDTYAIQEVNIIDVKNSQLIENQTIVIENGLITGIFDSDDYSKTDDIQVLDYNGYFVVPGLIDAHVHLATNPSGEDNFEATKKRLDYLLKNGVTTVRDMAGDARFLSFLSRQAALDEIPSPDIYYSALIAGQSFFKDPRTKLAAQGIEKGQAPWMRGINAKSDIPQIIAEAKGTGATGIKIYANLDKIHVQKVVSRSPCTRFKSVGPFYCFSCQSIRSMPGKSGCYVARYLPGLGGRKRSTH